MIYGIFLSTASVDIPNKRGDWIPVEHDGKFFPGEITHAINKQYQV